MAQIMKTTTAVSCNDPASLQTDSATLYQSLQDLDLSSTVVRQTLENALRDRLAYLEDRIAHMKKEIREAPSEHIDEANCVLADDAVFRNVLQSRMAEVRQIESALFRLKNDTYGFCLICDEPIALGRLQLLPFSTYCSKCTD